MKIYTKTGDQGETSLMYGQRTRKDDVRVEAYGTVDELNSVIGLAAASLRDAPEGTGDLVRYLLRVQRDLFDIGRDLATPPDRLTESHVTGERVELLERMIDRLDEGLPPLRQFILPGGAFAAALLHQARTVARRAERLCVALLRQQEANLETRRYLNRLSDLLFVMARTANHRLGGMEPVVDFSAPPEDVGL